MIRCLSVSKPIQLSLIAVWLLILIFIYGVRNKVPVLETSQVSRTRNYGSRNSVYDEIAQANYCIFDKLEALLAMPHVNSTLDWMSLYLIPRECCWKLKDKLPLVIPDQKFYEKKYFVQPLEERKESTKESCTIVTFGIGHETNHEAALQRLFPICEFVGFDPDDINKDIFESTIKGAKYVQAVVSGTNETFDGFFLSSDGKSQNRKRVNSTSGAYLLATHVGANRSIDLLNIDIEGAEYNLLPRLLIDPIYQNICFFNVELHHPEGYQTGSTIQSTFKLFQQLARSGTWLWLNSESLFDIYFPTFFVNYKNPYCIDKYLKNRIL